MSHAAQGNVCRGNHMLTETVTPEFAAQLELCEVNAWLDMYAAAPIDFARQLRLEIIGGRARSC